MQIQIQWKFHFTVVLYNILTHLAQWHHMVTQMCVNIGSGNGLVPEREFIDDKSTLVQVMAWYHHWSGSKTSPEPMLTNFYEAIWSHKAPMS